MSTYANLYLKTEGMGSEGLAHISSDGYPSFALVDLARMAERAFRCKEDPEIHFIGELFADWATTGYGWAPGSADFASYAYQVDFKEKKLVWEVDNEKSLVVFLVDRKVLWRGKIMKYETLNDLRGILEKIEDEV